MNAQPNPGVPAAVPQDEYVLSVRDILGALRRRLWVILLSAVVLAGLVVGFGLLRTPVYEASTSILVTKEEEPAEDATISVGNEVQELQVLTQTVTEAIDTLPVAEEVVRRLDLQESPEDLLENLNVRRAANSQFVEITYQDPDPERARQVAGAVATVTSERVSELGPGAGGLTATIWQEATVPDSPANRDPLRNGLIALLLGAMIGVGLALLIELLDDSWRSPEEVERVSGVPNFGVIPRFDAAESGKGARTKKASVGSRRDRVQDEAALVGELSERLVTVAEPVGSASEAYRALRTSLLYTPTEVAPKVILVTSPGRDEGKSVTCANLAVVLAQAGKRILVMDCNLRKPAMHELFGLGNSDGVANVLAEERDPGELWQEPLRGLKVLPTGPVPPEPTELLGSGRFARLVGEMRERFDYVLVDASPTGPVPDPVILSTQGDGVLLVIDSRNTSKRSVRQAMRDLQMVGARVLGTVVNNAKTAKGDRNGYA